MRITDVHLRPVTQVRYRRARHGGGTETATLPVLRLGATGLPSGFDAVLVTGDLQGVAYSPYGGEPVLLGVAVADQLRGWADLGILPDPRRLAVVLAGDLYSAPRADCRGASGPVDEVWLAFAMAGCPLVVGVAGNHDQLSAGDLADLGSTAALLDGAWIDAGGVRFAGVGRVVGSPGKPGRRDRHDQMRRLACALAGRPSVLVLHEGPPGERSDQPGSDLVGAHLRSAPPALTVCGHVGWRRPLARIAGGHVLNVDGRVVVLTAADARRAAPGGSSG